MDENGKPTRLRLGVPGKRKGLYEVAVLLRNGHRDTVLVDARTYRQARRITQRYGYLLMDDENDEKPVGAN